jgi:hypothetical protein
MKRILSIAALLFLASVSSYAVPSTISSLTALPGPAEGDVALAWTTPYDYVADNRFRIDYTTDAAKLFQHTDYRIEIPTVTSQGESNVTLITGLGSGAGAAGALR